MLLFLRRLFIIFFCKQSLFVFERKKFNFYNVAGYYYIIFVDQRLALSDTGLQLMQLIG